MTAHEAKHQAQLQQWTQQISECRRSGQSVRQWCAEKGINTKTYYRWEREAVGLLSRGLTVAHHQETQPVFVPVAQTNPTTQEVKSITILQSDIRIDVPNGVDPAVIQAIIAALRLC